MKIAPLTGGGMPGQDLTIGVVQTGERMARAKAIASGQQPVEQVQEEVQEQKPNIKTIQMKTQVSTNRDQVLPEVNSTEAVEQVANSNTNEPVEVAEATKPLSPQFAALAKAKRALQVKERELAQREAALKTQNPAGNEDLIAKLKTNPLGVLLDNGITYDQLTESLLAQQSGNTPELIALKAEIKALKEAMENQFSSRDKAAEDQVLADLTREAKAITAQGDQFEAIREAKAQSEVVKLIHRVWEKGWPEQGYEKGDVMDIEKAAQFVEDQLVEEAIPFAKLNKVQKRLTPQEVVQAQAQQPVAKPGTKVMRTLTNRDTAMPVMDRRARAIAAMNGTLKK
jgi:hypothetical protein